MMPYCCDYSSLSVYIGFHVITTCFFLFWSHFIMYDVLIILDVEMVYYYVPRAID